MLDVTAVVCSLVILSIISIVLNSFCIYIIKTNTKFHEKPSSVFVMNLLITHLFQSIFVFPLYAGKKLKVDNFYMAQFFSNGFRLTYLLSFYGACFGVLNISLDRFLATYLLNRYRIYVSFKNVLIVIAVTWLYVFVLCLIPFVPESKSEDIVEAVSVSTNSSVELTVSSTYVHNRTLYVNTSSYPHDVVVSSTVDTPLNATTSRYNFSANTEAINFNETRTGKSDFFNTSFNVSNHENTTTLSGFTAKKNSRRKFYYYIPQKEWTVFMVFCNAALPLVLIILCYTYVVFRLKRLKFGQPRRLNRGVPCNENMLKVKEFRKYQLVTYLTLVLSVTYTICWSPSIIYYTIFSVCEQTCFVVNWDDSFIEKHVVYIIKYLSFVNSLCSPLIYCFHHPEMQRQLSKMRHTFAIQPEPPNPNKYKLSIHHIQLNELALPGGMELNDANTKI